MAPHPAAGRGRVHPEQYKWLGMIKDHIATSPEDVDRRLRLRPFSEQGDWARRGTCSGMSSARSSTS
jgi:hypothetical protein